MMLKGPALEFGLPLAFLGNTFVSFTMVNRGRPSRDCRPCRKRKLRVSVTNLIAHLIAPPARLTESVCSVISNATSAANAAVRTLPALAGPILAP